MACNCFITTVVKCCGLFCLLPVVAILAVRYWITRCVKPVRRGNIGSGVVTVAFFHPYCNAGGGGERVLWCAVQAIQKRYPNSHCIVYTGDSASPEEIRNKVRKHFNMSVPEDSVKFVFLKKRHWVEAVKYPFFTLLGQSVGSVLLGLEALTSYVPDIYLDTMGYAFTLPIFRYLGGCKVGCYVHYPTISTDMLSVVRDRTAAHNNRSFISKSPALSYLKMVYYKLFAFLYGSVGRCSHLTMVNSSWTKGHITSIWGESKTQPINLIYPPCDITEFEKIPLVEDSKKKVKSIVSVAQFRPEKNQALQVAAFAQLVKKLSPEKRETVKLVVIGSCRDDGDAARVTELRELCAELEVSDLVEFAVNISFDELKQRMQDGTIGLHTMWNEHFGIGVVECMAAGLVMLAHNSGGPRMDIVVPHNEQTTGFLASSEEQFAQQMSLILTMADDELMRIRTRARQSMHRFTEEEFSRTFLTAVEPLFTSVS